ncbi:MAG: Carboxylesterase 2 [Owenweeksia sp. TMED14]|nr:MAG: Carboxylesterase 2 [Owenweeksia sp. TMED14]|tara:strand:- start:2760 stop:3410 length:651 start_codon:yes stop_codon:yes gene_type:complete
MNSPPKAFHSSLISEGNEENRQEIWLLHGYASNEADLHSLTPHFGDNYKIRSLRATFPLSSGGFAWYGLDFDINGVKRSDVHQAEESMHFIAKALDWHQSNFPKAKRPIILGFSQGGILANALAFNYPEKVFCVISIASYFPLEWSFLKQGKTKVPQLAAVGTEDAVVPMSMSIPTYNEAIKKYGMNVEVKTYTMPHSISPECFTDIIKFLDEIKS